MLPDPFSLLFVVTLATPPALSPSQSNAHRPIANFQTSPTSSFRFASAPLPPSTALMRTAGVKPLRHPVAKKATAAVAGGILGFFAGTLAGAGFGSLAGEDGALAGMIIGAPAGAVAGGFLGALWAR